MFYVKLIGIALILTGTTAVGWMIANNYSRRPDQLQSVIIALGVLGSEINYSHTPMPVACRRVAAASTYPANQLFLRFAGSIEDRQRRIGAAWNTVVGWMFTHTALSRADCQALADLGNTLGKTGSDEQMKHLETASRRLASHREQSLAAMEKNRKLWMYTGFLTGLALVLVLL